MRLPDPIANTTTEAYLAYKAGVLAEGDLKPKLYEPYIHLDAWLAYWAGLTTTYPVKNVGKNLFNGNTIDAWLYPNGTPASSTKDRTSVDYIPVTPNTSYVLHGTNSTYLKFTQFDSSKTAVSQQTTTSGTSLTATTGPNTTYVRIGWGNADKGATDVILEKGSTATAYEPYSGEPEILTDEEAYIAYLSGVTNTYPEEFRDPADIRVAAYLRYLISARWGRPEYPVTNEELYLSMLKAQYIPSGDPSSDIVIDGTAKAAFVDVKMYGDTYQQSYDGKNIIDYITGLIASGGGLTNTINSDGTITTTGKPNGNYNKIIEYYDLTPFLEDGATYTLSSTLYDNKTAAQVRRMKISDSSTYSYDTLDGAKSFKVDKSQYTYRMGILTNTMSAWGDESLTITKGYQLEKSATATSFEPYVGGQPSPNPDYPQPIQTVTGLQTVEVVGKNLFNATATPWVKNIAYNTAGQQNWGGYYGIVEYQQVEASTQYIFSNDLNKPIHYGLAYYDSSKTLISTTTVDTTTFTTPANCAYIRFAIESSTVPTLVQLELGSTATAYAPYSKHAYEINLGKNLFDYYGLPLSDKFLNGNGVMETGTTQYKNQEIAVTGGETFYWSSEAFGPNASTYLRLGQFNGNTFISRNLYRSNTSITLNKNTTRVVLSVDYEPSLDRYFTNPMFAKGSTSTAYAPYFEPIELCKLGAYQDYIWKDQDEWKVHKAIGKYIFTGEEAWTWDNAIIPRLYLPSWILANLGIHAGIPPNANTLPIGKTNRFSAKTFQSFYTGSEGDGFAMSTTGQNFQVCDNSWSSESSAKNDVVGLEWLYALATGYATDTVITNQALIDQLEALVKGGSEEGTTYIKVSTPDPNLPGLLYVEAAKYV